MSNLPLVMQLGRGTARIRTRDVCCQRPGSSLLPFLIPTPAHPVPIAFASTFLCSQESQRLASMVNAYLPSGEEEQGSHSCRIYITGSQHGEGHTLLLQMGKPRLKTKENHDRTWLNHKN